VEGGDTVLQEMYEEKLVCCSVTRLARAKRVVKHKSKELGKPGRVVICLPLISLSHLELVIQ
jgi:hypothetical protein